MHDTDLLPLTFVVAVVDGDDMTRYDDITAGDARQEEDLDTMNDLELELASQTGRLTGLKTLTIRYALVSLVYEW